MKRLIVGLVMVVLALSVRHYGDDSTLNQGFTLGPVGYETVGVPGLFVVSD